MEFRTPYDGERHRYPIHFLDENGEQALGRTKQSAKDECDINRIIALYDRTGLISHVNEATAQYGDYTEINEYQQCLDMVMRAQGNFDELPSDIRKLFDNDPGKFFEFATNPDNHDKMVELGLANPKPVEEPPNSGKKPDEKQAAEDSATE